MPSSFIRNNQLVVDGGATIVEQIVQGGTLWMIGLAPTDASVPNTACVVDLVNENDEFRAQVLELGEASSDANGIPTAHFNSDEVKLPDDERLKLRATVYNLTGAAVNWVLFAIAEVEE